MRSSAIYAISTLQRSLLYLVVVLELFDGAQTILSGIIAGVGKQRLGAAANVIAYWCAAVSGSGAWCLGVLAEGGGGQPGL